jgi:hypothetical protein
MEEGMTRLPTYAPLPERAAQTLRWIGEGGLASLDQLVRRFWSQARPRSAYRYLHPLVQAGYLLTAPHTALHGGQDLYVLTAQGSAMLGIAPPFVRVGWPHPQEFNHLLLGQEVRLVLEARLARVGHGGEILAWRTDYLLRHLTPPAHSPDAIADIQAEFRQTARSQPELLHIEIDGAYYGARLSSKLAAYGSLAGRVVWACLPPRVERLRHAAAAYPNIEVLPISLPHPTGGSTR